MKSASCAVAKTSGKPPACGQSSCVGTGISMPLVDDRQLRLAAAADDRHHAVAGGRSASRPVRSRHLAGELQAGDVRRPAGRRRVEPAALHHVGAVEAGGAHAHEHLVLAGPRVGVLLDEDLAVADRDGAHGGGV